MGADLRALAQEYTPEAIGALVSVMRGDNASATVAAARELLDRGHGKASQVIGGDADNPLHMVTEVLLRGVRAS